MSTPVMRIHSAIRTPARGFTMVEMLVALVVLAVGMLGVAGLFVISLRSGGTAISRMQAVNLASDMADRIRSNRRAGATYAGVGAAGNCIGRGAINCTEDQMAAADVAQWQLAIDQAFPGNRADGTIVYTAPATPTAPATYVITVTWREQGRTADETESIQTYVTRVELPTN
jgi:type IV pilus assembly protein PilV